MTMVERVARAICEAEYGDENAAWENQIPAAIASIKAMRDPTTEVGAAIAEAGILDGSHAGTGLGCRQEGIDAALNSAHALQRL